MRAKSISESVRQTDVISPISAVVNHTESRRHISRVSAYIVIVVAGAARLSAMKILRRSSETGDRNCVSRSRPDLCDSNWDPGV